ncbi:cytochrome P450 [Arthrobacter sp. NtRootA1]|uniref:cytochrome P450 n=1 Tax=Micrococcaceae TaxID=1268 RepID=UPI001CC6F8D4|nr:cytochrome P450 [Arthrobacter sp. NtRootA1]BCW05898.1 cytochrome P450 [Arthrobacter sp. NtRootA1]
MKNATKASRQGAQFPPRLPIERDPVDRVAPSSKLAEARRSGEWPSFDFIDPMVGGSGVQDAKAITRYAEVREVLRAPGTRLGIVVHAEEESLKMPGMLLVGEGEEHRRAKSVLVRHLNPRRVQELRPELERIVDELLDRLATQPSPIDLVAEYTSQLPALMVSHLLGIPYEEASKIDHWTRKQSDQTVSAGEVQTAISELKAYTAEKVTKARENPGNDLLSALVHDHTDVLSDEESGGLVFSIITASLDTTARFSTLVILTLLRNAEQRAIMQEAGGISEANIDELIRYLSPAPAAQWRYITEDLEIGEKSLKAGERVQVSLLAANWDPELVGDHPELDLRRKPIPHVAFGYGMHQCPGQHLARLEVSILVSKLFNRYPGLRLAEDIDDLEWLKDDLLYATRTLPVTW